MSSKGYFPNNWQGVHDAEDDQFETCITLVDDEQMHQLSHQNPLENQWLSPFKTTLTIKIAQNFKQ